MNKDEFEAEIANLDEIKKNIIDKSNKNKLKFDEKIIIKNIKLIIKELNNEITYDVPSFNDISLFIKNINNIDMTYHFIMRYDISDISNSLFTTDILYKLLTKYSEELLIIKLFKNNIDFRNTVLYFIRNNNFCVTNLLNEYYGCELFSKLEKLPCGFISIDNLLGGKCENDYLLFLKLFTQNNLINKDSGLYINKAIRFQQLDVLKFLLDSNFKKLDYIDNDWDKMSNEIKEILLTY